MSGFLRAAAAAAACAAALCTAPLPAFALDNAYAEGYLKVNLDSLGESKVYVTCPYILTDAEDRALTFENGAFSMLSPIADEGDLYYRAENAESTVKWEFERVDGGAGCIMHAAGDRAKMLTYNGGEFTLTDSSADALTVGFQLPFGSADHVQLWDVNAQKIIAWNGTELVYQTADADFAFFQVCGSATAYFYYADGQHTTAQQYAELTAWNGDTVTVPAFPPGISAERWDLIDPTDNNKVLGSFQPGEAFGPFSETAYFLAAGTQAVAGDAAVRIVGTGKTQTLDVKKGQEINITLPESSPDTFLLYDSAANAAQLTAEAADSGKVLHFTASDSNMTLCACDPVDENLYVRVMSVDDLLLMRDVINHAESNENDYRLRLYADLDLSAVCGEDVGSWEPIAPARNGEPGAGRIYVEGQKHSISNLYIDTQDDAQGLFGSTALCSVKALALTASVKGGSDVGCLAGHTVKGGAVGVSVKAEVSGTDNVGMLFGCAEDLVLTSSSYTVGSVTASGKNGGMFYGNAGRLMLMHGFAYGTATGGTTVLGTASGAEDDSVENIWTNDQTNENNAAAGIQAADDAAFADGTVLEALFAALPTVWVQGELYPVLAVGSFQLHVSHDEAGGSLKIEKTVWDAGQPVIVTAKAIEGYRVRIVATDETTGKELLVRTDDTTEDTYYFFMPMSDVSLEIHFDSVYLRGDANCDGDVTVADAIMLARVIAEDPEANITEQGKINADCDGADGLTPDDTVTLLRHLAGILRW